MDTKNIVEIISIRKTAIVYHANCVDGFTSAYIASKFLDLDRCEFFPETYGSQQPISFYRLRGFEAVVYLDFRPAIEEWSIHPGIVGVVIDHHPKSFEDVKLAHPKWVNILDSKYSGAMLTYMFFAGKPAESKLIHYVQDYDLYKFELPKSRQINAFIASVDKTFIEYQFLSKTLDNNPELCSVLGSAILKNQENMIKRINKNALKINNITYVNSAILVNELGDSHSGSVCIWHVMESGKFKCSFRGMNARKLAQLLGGEGHELAAGAITEVLPWEAINSALSLNLTTTEELPQISRGDSGSEELSSSTRDQMDLF